MILLFIIDTELFLYEHQSTYNPNMPLRDLFYISVNIRNWWIRNPFILPYYRKYLHHNLSYFTMEQKRKNKAEVIAMSIFEYDKEEEERKLRKS